MAYTSADTALTCFEAPSLKLNVETTESQVADVLFGSIAGIAGKIVEYPFDTIKVRLQVQPLHGEALYKGPIDCIIKSIQQEGVSGLFKGISAPLLGSMAENAVLFVSYNYIQNAIRKLSNSQSDSSPLSMTQLCTAGFLSGASVSFVMTPVELIKCRLQAQEVKFKGPISVIKHTLKHHGISGMYRGHVATLAREAFGGAAWFGAYEFAIRKFISNHPTAKSKDDLATWQLMSAGALAGISYNAALFPADVIKNRQQSFDTKQGFIPMAKEIYRTQGMKGFYRGFGITIARSAPTSAIIFATYEWLNKNLQVEF